MLGIDQKEKKKKKKITVLAGLKTNRIKTKKSEEKL